jgi:FAD/FMN-containing dehydrogenase
MSGKSGEAVLVDLSRLDRILVIDPVNMTVTVEAGATWKAIHAALAESMTFDFPSSAPFSGAGATVGGGSVAWCPVLRVGTVWNGCRYPVLSMDVVLADGSVHALPGRPHLQCTIAIRCFAGHGPDLTGLFLHDGGAFGIKTKAHLRVIRRPAHTGYASFAFRRIVDAVDALCAIQREGLIEDGYIMDPGATDHLDVDAAAEWPGPCMPCRAIRKRRAGGCSKSLLAMSRGGLRCDPARATFHCIWFALSAPGAGMNEALAECAPESRIRIDGRKRVAADNPDGCASRPLPRPERRVGAGRRALGRSQRESGAWRCDIGSPQLLIR